MPNRGEVVPSRLCQIVAGTAGPGRLARPVLNVDSLGICAAEQSKRSPVGPLGYWKRKYVLACELSPVQNGQPWKPGLVMWFHSMMPAGPRVALLVPESGPYSPTTTTPGRLGSAWTVNGLRKPIA